MENKIIVTKSSILEIEKKQFFENWETDKILDKKRSKEIDKYVKEILAQRNGR